jgi:hypothetical protein
MIEDTKYNTGDKMVTMAQKKIPETRTSSVANDYEKRGLLVSICYWISLKELKFRPIHIVGVHKPSIEHLILKSLYSKLKTISCTLKASYSCAIIAVLC